MSPNDSKQRSLAEYGIYFGSQENPNPNYEEDYNTWLEELIYRLRFVNHNLLEDSQDSDDSDSDDSDDVTETESQNSVVELDAETEFVPPPLPEPLLWLPIGGEFELLRNLLPPEFEIFFFSNLHALIRGVPFPNFEEPHLPNRAHEVPMAKDFYMRGLRFHGQMLTAEEADEAVEDFVSFFMSRGALLHNQ
jgi:hypothetical protein